MSIDKNTTEDKILDFEGLKNEGIGFIENLSGKVWTDYNEHDPGITILEQLCFALTDLGYRASLPIADLLTPPFGKEQDNFKQLLYLLSDVFPCNPVTINDMRKYIIDIPGIRNAWVSVAPNVQIGKQVIGGVYNIKVGLSDREKLDTFDQRAKEAEIKIREKLLASRNLCEDIHNITFLTRQDIWLQNTELELEHDADPEVVLARIYLELDKYLSQNVQFYSLDDLLAKGISVSNIYEGPVLERGFILDQFLTDKIETVTYSKLITIISRVDGVKSVRKFSLKTDNAKKGAFDIPPDKTPFIVMPDENTQGDIVLYKNNIKVNYKLYKFNNEFLDQKAREKRQYDININENQRFGIPAGNYQQPGAYYSIQRSFPANYGLARTESYQLLQDNQLAKIRQLKGYLAIFEQFMADYLAQLENIPVLLSADETMEQSYFYRQLTDLDVPGISRILKSTEDVTLKTSNSFDINVNFTYQNYTYATGLAEINKKYDHFATRRNQFLDHLLARFGEEFLNYYIEDFNYYYEEEDFPKFEIKNKCLFLQNYLQISKERGKAPDYSQSEKNVQEGTGLDMRLQLLLGLNQYEYSYKDGKRYMAEVVLDEKIWFRRYMNDPEAGAYYTHSGYVHPLFVEYDLSAADDTYKPLSELETQYKKWENYRKERVEKHKEEYTRPIHDGFEETLKDIVIDEDLLQHGSLRKNYYIGRTSPGGYQKRNEGSYVAVFYNERTNKLRKLGEFHTQLHAFRTVQRLKGHIRKLNMFSEGYHMVEHLLLRPQQADKNKPNWSGIEKYQVEITDKHGCMAYFQGTLYFDKAQIHHYHHSSHAFDIIASGCLYINYYTNRDENGKYYIELRNEHSELIATCPKKFNDLPEAFTYYLTLVHFCQSIVYIHAHEKEHHIRYAKISDFTPFLPENFYSFQVSVVLPDWPARFKDPEFITLLKQTFRDNIPAHIQVHFIMLNPFRMLSFEKAYQQWQSLKADTKATENNLNNAAFHVTEHLLRHLQPSRHNHTRT